jgi:hypothetical protein
VALTRARPNQIILAMTEHWFMTIMLAVVGLEGAVCCALAYKAFRRSEQIEALTAATYLEARKALTQSRS